MSRRVTGNHNNLGVLANMYDVIGIGRSCIDHLALLESMPPVDGKVPMVRYRTVGGGQTATAMVALSRLGLNVAYFGRVGDDGRGRRVLEELEGEGVDTSGVFIEEGGSTPVALIFVDGGTGTRTIAFLDSMSAGLPPDRVDVEALLSARCLLIDPQETLLGVRIAGEARRRGIRIIYDAEHMVAGFREMLSCCDYVVGSEDVAGVLGAKSPEEALEELFSYGPRAAAITLGERGSVCLSSDGLLRTPAFKVEVTDTTAAGDAFHAGFAYSVLKGWELERTLEFSNALGALACRGLGGRESLPALDEVMELVGRRPG